MVSLCGSFRKQLFILAVPALMLATPVLAASAPPIVELPPSDGQMMETLPAVTPCCGGSGWYLRGDIGYAVNNDPTGTFSGNDFVNESWDNSWIAGVGLGYRFNDAIRVDLTGEYRAASDVDTTDFAGGRQTGELQSNVILFNAYYDIANLSGFTPYVGAGIGGAYHRLDRINEIGATPPAVTFTFGDNKWALAAAAMAGVSYDVSENVKIDANYRYLYMGQAHSSTVTDVGVNADRVHFKDLSAHEFRLGMRYEFGGSGISGY